MRKTADSRSVVRLGTLPRRLHAQFTGYELANTFPDNLTVGHPILHELLSGKRKYSKVDIPTDGPISARRVKEMPIEESHSRADSHLTGPSGMDF